MNDSDNILKTEDLTAERTFVAPPSLDITKYRDLLGETDIPQERVDEFLGDIAIMMASFVAWGWDVRNIPAFLPAIFDDASGPEIAAVASPAKEGSNDEY